MAVSFRFNELSDPIIVARNGCMGAVPSCTRVSTPAIELAMHRMYNRPLDNWLYSDSCGSLMPPQEELPFIQHFHIPKTGGTAFNFLLHDYAGCPLPEHQTPCQVAITSVNTCVVAQYSLCMLYMYDVFGLCCCVYIDRPSEC